MEIPQNKKIYEFSPVVVHLVKLIKLQSNRASGDDYTEVTVGDSEALFNGGFDLSKKTKIVVHGWLSNGSNYMAERVRTGEIINYSASLINHQIQN